MIAEQKIRTQKILGGLLKESEVSKNQKNSFHGSQEKPRNPKLSDFGISKKESHTFQKIASMPEEKAASHKEVPAAKNPKLSDFGITKDQSSTTPTTL